MVTKYVISKRKKHSTTIWGKKMKTCPTPFVACMEFYFCALPLFATSRLTFIFGSRSLECVRTAGLHPTVADRAVLKQNVLFLGTAADIEFLWLRLEPRWEIRGSSSSLNFASCRVASHPSLAKVFVFQRVQNFRCTRMKHLDAFRTTRNGNAQKRMYPPGETQIRDIVFFVT